MVQTQDNFNKHGNPTDENGEGYAQPKGVQTRAAIAKHLAAKLKVGGVKMDLADLLQADQDMQMNMENRDRFWDQNLENERQKIQQNREKAEAELQDAIHGKPFDEFKMLSEYSSNC